MAVFFVFFLLTAEFAHFVFLIQIPVFSCAVLIGRLWENALNIVVDDIKNALQSKKKSMGNHTNIDPETLFFGDLVDDGCQIFLLIIFGSILVRFSIDVLLLCRTCLMSSTTVFKAFSQSRPIKTAPENTGICIKNAKCAKAAVKRQHQ